MLVLWDRAKVRNLMKLRGVVFDLDGTLVRQELDFEAIRREIGLPPDTPLLEALERMTVAERDRAGQILDVHEQAAALRAALFPGVAEVLEWLDGQGLRRGLLSRNSRRAVEVVLGRCGLRFDPALAREDAPFKPNPHGLHLICDTWRVEPAAVLMVGDYLYDLQAGRSAGTRTALLTHGREWPFANLADWTLATFAELPAIIQTHLE
jgi:HAD superfamily hydrolase (TIGR01549 family)